MPQVAPFHPLWTATPAAYERIGLGFRAVSADPPEAEAARRALHAALQAALPAAATGSEVTLLLATEILAARIAEHASARETALLERLRTKNFIRTAIPVPCGDMPAALALWQGNDDGLRMQQDPELLDLLLDPHVRPFALVTCVPSATLALTRYVERSACFRVALWGRLPAHGSAGACASKQAE